MKSKNNYISAKADWKTGEITVWERDATTGARTTSTFASPYYFYVRDETGPFTSIYEEPLKKLTFKNRNDFKAACDYHTHRYESDIAPIDKILMNEYYGLPTPKLNVCFLDIEVDVDFAIGWSEVRNPYAPVNAITMYMRHTNTYYTLAVPPPEWIKLNGLNVDRVNFNAETSKVDLMLFDNERDLLDTMLNLLEDVDLISGWNSEFFDLPYLVNRVKVAMGDWATKRFCFPDAGEPREAEVERFGTPEVTYQLFGRIHLDSLALYKKFTFGGRQSYSLSAIAELELSIPKIEFAGNLQQLYLNDFDRFLDYNIRDVEILVGLDKKLKFVNMANLVAHESCVFMEAVLGSVRYIDTAITLYAHNNMKRIVNDKQEVGETEKVEGALVITPVPGMYERLFSVDLNSLYPSIFMTLNLSLEKIVGQFMDGENAWVEIKNKTTTLLTLVFDRPEAFGFADSEDRMTATAADWFEVLTVKQWAVSAIGLVLDQSSGPGVVPQILDHWYKSRKAYQKKMRATNTELRAYIAEQSVDIDAELLSMLK